MRFPSLIFTLTLTLSACATEPELTDPVAVTAVPKMLAADRLSIDGVELRLRGVWPMVSDADGARLVTEWLAGRAVYCIHGTEPWSGERVGSCRVGAQDLAEWVVWAGLAERAGVR